MITTNTYLNVCRNDNTKEIRMERKEPDYRIKDEQLLLGWSSRILNKEVLKLDDCMTSNCFEDIRQVSIRLEQL